MTHTPGKWEAEYGADGYYLVTRDGGMELTENTEANARLIAAAPDLFVAADCLANYYAKAIDVGPGPNPSREAILWKALRVALAKARGEQ